MKLRKTPRTRRVVKAARNRKRERDGMIGQWNFINSGNASYILDLPHIGEGDIITISDESGSSGVIRIGDIPKLKNPKRVHPARKRKAKQMMRPIVPSAEWMSIGSGQMQVEKISETQWKVIGTGVSLCAAS